MKLKQHFCHFVNCKYKKYIFKSTNNKMIITDNNNDGGNNF